MTSPRIRVREVDAFERPVSFRFPFRFGAARVEGAPQAFVRLRIEDTAGRESVGWAAEMLMPKWFDKTPDLSPDQNINQLRRALRHAFDAILSAGSGTAFGLHAAVEGEHHKRCAEDGLSGLIASFGLALVDRAVIDALARLENAPAAALVRTNQLGITSATARDRAGFDFPAFLATLHVPQTIAARHTVGLGDPLTDADLGGQRLADGLPETLEEVISAYGHRLFKLKISGDVGADIERLQRIAALLGALAPDYQATMDGNEQFADEEHVLAFLERLDATPSLAELRRRLLFLEQPIARARALTAPVRRVDSRIAVEIDESDADIGSFLRARDLGYRGISSKSCKGFYRAILNRARIAQWNRDDPAAGFFMSAEDLTTQSGMAVQQDLVLAGLIGADHVERNGHHFANGMSGAGQPEQTAYRAAHPDLYGHADGHTRLMIRDGRISLESVAAAHGLGTAVTPDSDTLKPMNWEETDNEP